MQAQFFLGNLPVVVLLESSNIMYLDEYSGIQLFERNFFKVLKNFIVADSEKIIFILDEGKEKITKKICIYSLDFQDIINEFAFKCKNDTNLIKLKFIKNTRKFAVVFQRKIKIFDLDSRENSFKIKILRGIIKKLESLADGESLGLLYKNGSVEIFHLEKETFTKLSFSIPEEIIIDIETGQNKEKNYIVCASAHYRIHIYDGRNYKPLIILKEPFVELSTVRLVKNDEILVTAHSSYVLNDLLDQNDEMHLQK